MNVRTIRKPLILCIFIMIVSFLGGCTSQEEYLNRALDSLDDKNFQEVATISESFKEETAEGFRTQVLIIVEQATNNKEYDKAIETMESLKDVVDFSSKIEEIKSLKNAYIIFNQGEEIYRQIPKTVENNKKYELITKALEKYNLVENHGDEGSKALERIKSLNDIKTQLNYEDIMASANMLFENEEYKAAIDAVNKALEILDSKEGKEILTTYQKLYNSYRLELEKEIRAKLTTDSWSKPNGEVIKTYMAKSSDKYFSKFNLYISLNRSEKEYWLNIGAGLTLPKAIDFNKIVITYDDNTYELNINDNDKSSNTNFKGTEESYRNRVDEKLIKILIEVSDSDKCTITFEGASNITKTLDNELKNNIKSVLRYYTFMEEE